MVTLTAFMIVLVGVAVLIIFAGRSAVNLVCGWPGRSVDGRRAMAIGTIQLAGTCGLIAVVPIAGPIAERRTGWEDFDGNGMLDPFANGAYDWVDINLGEAVRVLGALVFVVLAVTWLTLRAVDHPRPPREISRRERVARFWARH